MVASLDLIELGTLHNDRAALALSEARQGLGVYASNSYQSVIRLFLPWKAAQRCNEE